MTVSALTLRSYLLQESFQMLLLGGSSLMEPCQHIAHIPEENHQVVSKDVPGKRVKSSTRANYCTSEGRGNASQWV